MVYDCILLAMLAVSPVEGAAERPLLAQAKTAEATKPAAPKKAPGPASADAGALAIVAAPVDAGTPNAPKVAKVAMAPEVKTLVDRMQGFYEKTQDFSSAFRQDYFYKQFKRTQTSTGTVTFRKPAMMRWEYEKPSPRTFVLAGEKVYSHDPDAMTLTKAAVATDKLSASVTFLWGVGKLENEFNISKGNCPKCTGTQLVLEPLVPDSRFRRVLLEIDPSTAQVLKSTVIDPDGSENAISFLNLKTNTGIPESSFKLNPPAGTRVIDMTKPTK